MARNRGGKGGYRKPKRPAAVSGVGKDSARTDGGPGSALPIASGQAYGQRQATESALAQAPATDRGAQQGAVGTGSGSVRDGGRAPAPNIGGAGAAPGLWAPSQRPNEPITAGAVGSEGGQYTGNSPDMVLEILYSKWPSPWIAALMDR